MSEFNVFKHLATYFQSETTTILHIIDVIINLQRAS